LYDSVDFPFTRYECDKLVDAAKVIKAVPRPGQLQPNSPGLGFRMYCSQIYYKNDPSKPIKGLVVMAKARSAPPPIPQPTPSAALEWFGHRIRGLNYEQWHDNPDGSTVRGWHEHVWSPREADAYVVPARPEPRQKTMDALFRWGLTQWNIAVE